MSDVENMIDHLNKMLDDINDDSDLRKGNEDIDNGGNDWADDWYDDLNKACLRMLMKQMEAECPDHEINIGETVDFCLKKHLEFMQRLADMFDIYNDILKSREWAPVAGLTHSQVRLQIYSSITNSWQTIGSSGFNKGAARADGAKCARDEK